MNKPVRCHMGIASLLALTLSGAAWAQLSAPSSANTLPAPEVETKAVPAEYFQLTAAEPALRISAPPVQGAHDTLKRHNDDTEQGLKPLQVGYGRDLDAADRVLDLATLPWQTLGDGSKAVQIQLEASEAAGVRVGYRVTGDVNGLQVRFAGEQGREVYLQTGGDFDHAHTVWSPALDGERATVELRLLPGHEPGDYGFEFERLSHLVATGPVPDQKNTNHIGRSASCNRDAACDYPDTQLQIAARGAVKISVVRSDTGGTRLCSGVVIGGDEMSERMLLTSGRCIRDAAEASSVQIYWDFNATACGNRTVGAYNTATGGTLLEIDPTVSFALVRLRNVQHDRLFGAGWDPGGLYPDEDVFSLHHPQGDLKKISRGTVTGMGHDPARPGPVRQSFYKVKWRQGTTENGSVGAPIYVTRRIGDQDQHIVAGLLTSGEASCANPSGTDYYARFDLIFPMVVHHIRPSAVPRPTDSARVTRVEYYNPEFDYYFNTGRESDKQLLDGLRDSNGEKLWFRTSTDYRTMAQPASGLSTLTRYYLPQNARGGARGTHFYTALEADRQLITSTGKERFSTRGCADVPGGHYCNEGNDGYVRLPDNITPGQPDAARCRADESAAYRLYRPGDPNHRYVGGYTYGKLRGKLGWVGEGIVYCIATNW